MYEALSNEEIADVEASIVRTPGGRSFEQAMDAALLDTEMLSELLRQRNRAVTARAASYLQSHGAFAFSAFTRFEIERGYRE